MEKINSDFFQQNGEYLELMYEKYKKSPEEIDPEWKMYFSSLEEDFVDKKNQKKFHTQNIEKSSIIANSELSIYINDEKSLINWELSHRAQKMLDNFRNYGHLDADIRPIDKGFKIDEDHKQNIKQNSEKNSITFSEEKKHPTLNLSYYGISPEELAQQVSTNFTSIHQTTLSDLYSFMEKTYCGDIACEFSYLPIEEKLWWQKKIETNMGNFSLEKEEISSIAEDLVYIESFEQYLHKKFIGAKRFSIEGLESTVISLKQIILHLQKNTQNIILGMAHRGRLAILNRVIGKPTHCIMSEFMGNSILSPLINGIELGENTQKNNIRSNNNNNRNLNTEQNNRIFQNFNPTGDHEIEGDLSPSFNQFIQQNSFSGDVKYHMGWENSDSQGKRVALLPNPSHLESVNGVVMGNVKAIQDNGETACAVLIHGDAAFSGQGVVMETLAMAQLPQHKIGGTIHVVMNNQLGFTAEPQQGRSTRYCTDFAKGIEAPVFHVDARSIGAIKWISQIAVEYRETFGRDVVIDIIGYRLHGHNETDEPMFTQPLTYKRICSPDFKSICETFMCEYNKKDQYDELKTKIWNFFEEEYDKATKYSPDIEVIKEHIIPREWIKYWAEKDEYNKREKENSSQDQNYSTDIDKKIHKFGPSNILYPLLKKQVFFNKKDMKENDKIREITPAEMRKIVDFDCVDIISNLGKKITNIPQGLNVNGKIEKQYFTRREMYSGTLPLDWGAAESLAFATILHAGLSLRLIGQDVERGTFSHRHAVLVDQENGEKFVPLSTAAQIGKYFTICNSHLSEYGVLSFEYGYSTRSPQTLVIWEAQFGDFANGAQTVIDQYISSATSKWIIPSNLVMLLPHGYEGQGPEHSSARLERFLQLCAENNMTVCNCSTPASFFQLLCRQAAGQETRPLVVMTPKSLLRHKSAISTLEKVLDPAGFKLILSEGELGVDELQIDENVTRVILCSGKIYYELVEKKNATKNAQNVKLFRLEQLYPFPEKEIKKIASAYPKAKFFWSQEEPRNMGANSFVQRNVAMCARTIHPLKYAGRPESPSPAAGTMRQHNNELTELLSKALL